MKKFKPLPFKLRLYKKFYSDIQVQTGGINGAHN